MQKYFTSIFTGKIGYGLRHYNVKVCTYEDEIMRRVRPEEWERKIIFMPSEARLKIFLKNIK